MTTIKTLAEILADMGESISADSTLSSQTLPTSPKTTGQTKRTTSKDISAKPNLRTFSKSKKPNQPIKQDKTNKTNDNHILPNDIWTAVDQHTLSALKNVAIEPIYQNDQKINRLRWLAFYYLSNRELSQQQLRQKLLNKDCDPQTVADLLDEFATKGYQSDERTAFMLIRESIRRGRGKRYISQALKNTGIQLPYSLDELIQMADIANLSDGTILENQLKSNDNMNDEQKNEVNWLALAIEARCKKYGNTLPKDQKEKSRQLRFLQYRGFEMSVCFDALKYTLDDIDELNFI